MVIVVIEKNKYLTSTYAAKILAQRQQPTQNKYIYNHANDGITTYPNHPYNYKTPPITYPTQYKVYQIIGFDNLNLE